MGFEPHQRPGEEDGGRQRLQQVAHHDAAEETIRQQVHEEVDGVVGLLRVVAAERFEGSGVERG